MNERPAPGAIVCMRHGNTLHFATVIETDDVLRIPGYPTPDPPWMLRVRWAVSEFGRDHDRASVTAWIRPGGRVSLADVRLPSGAMLRPACPQHDHQPLGRWRLVWPLVAPSASASALHPAARALLGRVSDAEVPDVP